MALQYVFLLWLLNKFVLHENNRVFCLPHEATRTRLNCINALININFVSILGKQRCCHLENPTLLPS